MKKVVWLRIFRGTEILKLEDGSYKNENQLVKLTHDTLEWSNYMKTMRASNLCKVSVERVIEVSKDGEKDIEKFTEIEKEVRVALHGDDKPKLTPEQQRIADLEAKLEILMGEKSTKKEEKSELEDLQAEYKEKFGKKPHHLWKEKKLKELLNSK